MLFKFKLPYLFILGPGSYLVFAPGSSFLHQAHKQDLDE